MQEASLGVVVVVALFGGDFEDCSRELNQSSDYSPSLEMFVFTLPGNGLGSILAACVCVYLLFIYKP